MIDQLYWTGSIERIGCCPKEIVEMINFESAL